ncbi:hypothetical protein D3C75_1149030 [compost metagenome]
MQRQIDKRRAQQHNQQSGTQRHQQRLHQRPRQPLRVFRAIRLGSQPGGAHTQKEQQHKQEAGRRSTNRYAAEVNRRIEMADHRRIHQPQQGNADVGDDHWQRKTP